MRRLVALGVAVAVLVACAGDDDGAAPASPPSVSEAPSTSTATTAPTESSAPPTPASVDTTSPTPAAATEWPASTPEEHGVDSGLLADALVAIRDQIPYVHSVTIVQHGSPVLDAYFYPYDGSSPHNVASVTKSITTTLVGITSDQGLLSLDDPVLSFFPDHDIANRDERKERITVGDLAAMRSGFACEAEPDEPTLAAMEASPDYVQFALDLPMAAEPGTTFAYCSPGHTRAVGHPHPGHRHDRVRVRSARVVRAARVRDLGLRTLRASRTAGVTPWCTRATWPAGPTVPRRRTLER